LDKTVNRNFLEYKENNLWQLRALQQFMLDKHTWFWKERKKINK
jgi:hypothetical protein